MEVVINGVRYIPAASAVPASGAVAEAVSAAATALCLYGKHDKANRAALWDILRALSPEIARLAESDPFAACDAAAALTGDVDT